MPHAKVEAAGLPDDGPDGTERTPVRRIGNPPGYQGLPAPQQPLAGPAARSVVAQRLTCSEVRALTQSTTASHSGTGGALALNAARQTARNFQPFRFLAKRVKWEGNQRSQPRGVFGVLECFHRYNCSRWQEISWGFHGETAGVAFAWAPTDRLNCYITVSSVYVHHVLDDRTRLLFCFLSLSLPMLAP